LLGARIGRSILIDDFLLCDRNGHAPCRAPAISPPEAQIVSGTQLVGLRSASPVTGVPPPAFDFHARFGLNDLVHQAVHFLGRA
jgi:hypothetical protein